jgi:hypothetical protein
MFDICKEGTAAAVCPLVFGLSYYVFQRLVKPSEGVRIQLNDDSFAIKATVYGRIN